MAVDVKRIIQEMVVPDLQVIKSELATIKVEIKRLDEKIESIRASDLKRLDEKIDGGLKRFDEKTDSLREDVRNLREEFRLAIDIHERLASLEAKIGR